MKIFIARYREWDDHPKVLGTSDDSADDVVWINEWLKIHDPEIGNCPTVFYSVPMRPSFNGPYEWIPDGIGVMAYLIQPGWPVE